MDTWHPLTTGWTLRAIGDTAELPDAVAARTTGDRTLPATVPGCVHTDLLAAGLIPDPYLEENEARLGWIGRTDWRYETTFAVPGGVDAADRVDLVCAGLDTVARVELDGVKIGATRNMHRSYRWRVGELLGAGGHRLAVTFTSPQRHAERMRAVLGDLPGPNSATPEPFNLIRKMACNFGWDWGPILVTAGIWKPIGLHAWSRARLAAVRPQVTVDGGDGRVVVDADLEWSGTEAGGPLRLTATVADARADTVVEPGADRARVEVTVQRPRLWWPHGYGDQPRYDLTLTLSDPDGTVLETWTRRVGFRSIRLDTTPDSDGPNSAADAATGGDGSAFTLVVNDRPIFARGANWIPDDCFPARVDADRYRRRLRQAVDAHIDLLRVWGGGLYETDDFYEACDELGLLVWQDFCFACAAYPEEPPLAAEVEAEARENVTRLLPHPSLVLWNGNNENIWGFFDWGWQERLDGRAWGLGYYLDLLPRIVGEIDPTRPYWPGSPYSGSMDRHPNAPEHGCTHVWDVWNREDYTVYRRYVPRFVAEFGYQGPPTWATLRRAVRTESPRPDSPVVLAHQKAADGHAKLARGLVAHFPTHRPVEDWPIDQWHWLTQLNQARALTLGIEHFRSHRGRCMGTVVWQLNDCWPVISWAAVDGDGRRKPLWYALRRVYDSRLLTVQPCAAGLAAVAVSEDDMPWEGELTVERRTFAGEPLAAWTERLSLPGPGAVETALPTRVAGPGDPARELLVARFGGRRTTWFFAEDRELAYPEPRHRLEVVRDGTGWRVRIRAETLLRDVAVFADRLHPDAEVDDMLHTLLPGETVDVRVDGVPELSPEQLVPPVLRCANEVAVHRA